MICNKKITVLFLCVMKLCDGDVAFRECGENFTAAIS